MITRAILEAQRSLYVKGREEAIASISAFNGAIECIDNLLELVKQVEDHEAIQSAKAEAEAKDNGGTTDG